MTEEKTVDGSNTTQMFTDELNEGIALLKKSHRMSKIKFFSVMLLIIIVATMIFGVIPSFIDSLGMSFISG